MDDFSQGVALGWLGAGPLALRGVTVTKVHDRL